MTPTTSGPLGCFASPPPPALPEIKVQAVTEKHLFSVDDERFRPLKALMDSKNIKSLFIRELKQLSDRVITVFPPQEFLYIGIGRSPATVIAELQGRLGKDAACNIPLSDFQFLETCKKGRVGFKQKMTPEQQKALFHHFDKVLGSLASNRKVLIIDYVWSGCTLLSATYFFHQYFREKDSAMVVSLATGNSERKVHALALGDCLILPKDITSYGANLMQAIQPVVPAGCYDQWEYGDGFEHTLHCSHAKPLAEYTQRVTVADLARGKAENLCRNPLYDLLVDYLRAEDHEAVPAALFTEWVLYHEFAP